MYPILEQIILMNWSFTVNQKYTAQPEQSYSWMNDSYESVFLVSQKTYSATSVVHFPNKLFL